MRTRFRRQIKLVAMVLVGMGCNGDPTEPGRELVPWWIVGGNPGDPRVTLIVEGRALRIEVLSYGDGCREKGELRVSKSLTSRRVTVTPFDRETRAEICAAILLTFEHSAEIDFDTIGDWTIVVAGEDLESNPVEFEYDIQIGT